jgi:NTE family protein
MGGLAIPPLRITFSGGGVTGLAHIGALEAFQEKGLLGSVREYIGTSAGALMALCLCLGFTIAEMKAVCMGMNFESITEIEPESLMNIFQTFSIDTAKNMEKLLVTFLKAKGLPSNITFEGLSAAMPGKPRLRICTTNLNQCCPVIFDHMSTPTASVLFAVKASMAIPLIFAPCRHPDSGDLYVDGGVIAQSPFDVLTDAEREHAIAFAFVHDSWKKERFDSLSEFAIQLPISVYFHMKRNILPHWHSHIILFPRMDNMILKFSASKDEKEAIIQVGREVAIKFLEETNMKRERVPRRFSVS